jgi:PKD repeat protein
MLSSEPGFASYAGVGFQENAVAGLYGVYNGQEDLSPSDYQVQVNWGDNGDQWQPADLAGANPGSGFLVKGSHTYDTAKKYDVQVRATGPDGITVMEKTCFVTVSQMPSGIPGTQPSAWTDPPLLPSNVRVDFYSESGFNCYAGVGFQENALAAVNGYVNGQPDLKFSDYRAQINWGDSNQWEMADLASRNPGSPGSGFLVKGSHVYAQAGSYHVVVYAQGADGTSTSGETVNVTVSQMPSGIPGTQPPAWTDPPLPPSNVRVDFYSESGFSATAGVSTGTQRVAAVNGYLNGQQDSKVSDFHARINWGDNSYWAPADIVAEPNNRSSLLIQGSHTYYMQGTYHVVVYAQGPDGTSVSGEFVNVTVTPNPNPRVPTLTGGVSITALQGQPGPDTPLATFDDPNPPTMLTATIDYGDSPGSADTRPGTIRLVGGTTYEITGGPGGPPVYNKPGTYTVTITLSDTQGNGSQTKDTLKVEPPPNVDLQELNFDGPGNIPISIDGITAIGDPTNTRSEDIEWERGLRERPNSNAPWDTSQSAPAAFVQGNGLQAEVKFTVGNPEVTSITIKASNAGPYGDFPATVVPISNGIGTATFITSGIPDKNVDVNDLTFHWVLESVTFGDQEIPVNGVLRDTTHRIYTLQGTPVAPMDKPWATVLELAAGMVKYQSVFTDPTVIVEDLTRGIHYSSWKNLEASIHFLDPQATLVYDPSVSRTSEAIDFPVADTYDLSNFMSFLAKTKNPQQCNDNANLLSILARSLGVNVGSLWFAHVYPPLNDAAWNGLVPTTYFPAGENTAKTARFTFHQVGFWNDQVYDPSTRKEAGGDPYMDMSFPDYLGKAFPGQIEGGYVSLNIANLNISDVMEANFAFESFVPNNGPAGATTSVVLRGNGFDDALALFAVQKGTFDVAGGVTISNRKVVSTNEVDFDLTVQAGATPRTIEILGLESVFQAAQRVDFTIESGQAPSPRARRTGSFTHANDLAAANSIAALFVSDWDRLQNSSFLTLPGNTPAAGDAPSDRHLLPGRGVDLLFASSRSSGLDHSKNCATVRAGNHWFDDPGAERSSHVAWLRGRQGGRTFVLDDPHQEAL